MKGLDLYFIPWAFSNIGGLILLWVSWQNPKIGRAAFTFLFGWAAWKNFSTAQQTPEVYIEFAFLAINFYHDFILGWFADHIKFVVTMISIGQALIALGMLLKGRWVKAASLAAIFFFIAVSPLGVGSAFPFPLVASFAAYIIYKNPGNSNLWTFNMSTSKVV